MEKKYGFLKISLNEFNSWLKNERISRTISYIQQHHTYLPDYSNFNGTNHFQLQKSMKNYHVNENGWRDIGQHFTIFPDGTILTGRSLEYSPAGIRGANANAICIENLGNFDANGDEMLDLHANAILEVTSALLLKFNIPITTDRILYHHWYNLNTGERNNGTKSNKSCPGTNFFGGNKVADAQNNFIPRIKALVGKVRPIRNEIQSMKYVCVTASRLNVRIGAGANYKKATAKKAIEMGTILRVFHERGGWYKISNSKEYWISGKYTTEVFKAEVTASKLNIRKGPGSNYNKLGSLLLGQEVFISQEEGNWCKLNNTEKWVSKDYLLFSQS